MFEGLKKRWKYFVAKQDARFNEKADPKVQLEQAIAEAKEQHQRLREQAGNVIANQKQTEMRLNRALEDLEKITANTRQALIMQADAVNKGDAAKAAEFGAAAESLATRMLQIEHDVDDLKALSLQATQAADQAKAAVQQNSLALQRKLGERQKLLSQLDQAKMQEQVNTAMATLTVAVGTDVPTLNEVRDKIEARYAKAKAAAELTDVSVEQRVLEIEAATNTVESHARLNAMKAELGLPSGSGAPALDSPPAAPAG